MTLPHGFGSDRFTEPREPDKKCRLGKPCWRNRCTVHEWVCNHDDAWLLIKIVLGVVCLFGLIIGAFILYEAHYENVNEPIYRNIEGYNCDDLAEYVADKNSQWRYAEHRYEWLCVYEQIKEFQ